jgi:hypothetical protein
VTLRDAAQYKSTGEDRATMVLMGALIDAHSENCANLKIKLGDLRNKKQLTHQKNSALHCGWSWAAATIRPYIGKSRQQMLQIQRLAESHKCPKDAINFHLQRSRGERL